MQLTSWSAKITKRAKTRLKSVARTITIGHRKETSLLLHKPDKSLDHIYLTCKPDISRSSFRNDSDNYQISVILFQWDVYLIQYLERNIYQPHNNQLHVANRNGSLFFCSALHLYDHGNGPSNTPIPRQRSDLNRIIQMSQFTPSCTQLNQRNTETNSFCETTPKRHESAFTFLCCCIGYWTIKTEFAELPFT
jgi:hypothetical protein